MDATDVTAWATGVLAAVTLVYVWLTARIAKRAGEAAQAAERSAAAAERAVLVEMMPLVIASGGGGSNKAWELGATNLGRSAAVDLRVSLADAAGGEVAEGRAAVLKAGEGASLTVGGPEISAAASKATRTGRYRCEATYRNAFGQRFRTRAVVDVHGVPVKTVATWLEQDGEWVTLVPDRCAVGGVSTEEGR